MRITSIIKLLIIMVSFPLLGLAGASIPMGPISMRILEERDAAEIGLFEKYGPHATVPAPQNRTVASPLAYEGTIDPNGYVNWFEFYRHVWRASGGGPILSAQLGIPVATFMQTRNATAQVHWALSTLAMVVSCAMMGWRITQGSASGLEVAPLVLKIFVGFAVVFNPSFGYALVKSTSRSLERAFVQALKSGNSASEAVRTRLNALNFDEGAASSALRTGVNDATLSNIRYFTLTAKPHAIEAINALVEEINRLPAPPPPPPITISSYRSLSSFMFAGAIAQDKAGKWTTLSPDSNSNDIGPSMIELVSAAALLTSAVTPPSDAPMLGKIKTSFAGTLDEVKKWKAFASAKAALVGEPATPENQKKRDDAESGMSKGYEKIYESARTSTIEFLGTTALQSTLKDALGPGTTPAPEFSPTFLGAVAAKARAKADAQIAAASASSKGPGMAGAYVVNQAAMAPVTNANDIRADVASFWDQVRKTQAGTNASTSSGQMHWLFKLLTSFITYFLGGFVARIGNFLTDGTLELGVLICWLAFPLWQISVWEGAFTRGLKMIMVGLILPPATICIFFVYDTLMGALFGYILPLVLGAVAVNGASLVPGAVALAASGVGIGLLGAGLFVAGLGVLIGLCMYCLAYILGALYLMFQTPGIVQAFLHGQSVVGQFMGAIGGAAATAVMGGYGLGKAVKGASGGGDTQGAGAGAAGALQAAAAAPGPVVPSNESNAGGLAQSGNSSPTSQSIEPKGSVAAGIPTQGTTTGTGANALTAQVGTGETNNSTLSTGIKSKMEASAAKEGHVESVGRDGGDDPEERPVSIPTEQADGGRDGFDVDEDRTPPPSAPGKGPSGESPFSSTGASGGASHSEKSALQPSGGAVRPSSAIPSTSSPAAKPGLIERLDTRFKGAQVKGAQSVIAGVKGASASFKEEHPTLHGLGSGAAKAVTSGRGRAVLGVAARVGSYSAIHLAAAALSGGNRGQHQAMVANVASAFNSKRNPTLAKMFNPTLSTAELDERERMRDAMAMRPEAPPSTQRYMGPQTIGAPDDRDVERN
jgi:hypothetical protein